MYPYQPYDQYLYDLGYFQTPSLMQLFATTFIHVAVVGIATMAAHEMLSDLFPAYRLS